MEQLFYYFTQLRLAIAGILDPQQSEGSEAAAETTQPHFHHHPHFKISFEREASRQDRDHPTVEIRIIQARQF